MKAIKSIEDKVESKRVSCQTRGLQARALRQTIQRFNNEQARLNRLPFANDKWLRASGLNWITAEVYDLAAFWARHIPHETLAEWHLVVARFIPAAERFLAIYWQELIDAAQSPTYVVAVPSGKPSQATLTK